MARKRQRKRKLHGWDSLSTTGSVSVGTPPRAFFDDNQLQTYEAPQTTLVRVPDEFYCERLIIDIFPYIGRVDVQSPPYRIWQYAILVAEVTALFEWLGSMASFIDGDIWDNSNEFWDMARILQQGVAPVYDSWWPLSEGEGAPLVTGNTGTFISMADSPAGPERVHLDLNTKFGLREGQALFSIIGPTPTAEWETGDQLAWDLFYKGLWTQRQQ